MLQFFSEIKLKFDFKVERIRRLGTLRVIKERESYVAGSVASGVDTNVRAFLKVQEPGQTESAAAFTVANDGGLGLLKGVRDTSAYESETCL